MPRLTAGLRPAFALFAALLLPLAAEIGVSARGTSAPLLRSTLRGMATPGDSAADQGAEFWHKLAPGLPQLISYPSLPCQNSSYRLTDLTVLVYSASAIAAQRLPPIRDTWLRHLSDSGARVVAFTGSAVPPIPGVEMAVAGPIEVGPGGCDSGARGHCREMLMDQLRWIEGNVRSRLVFRADDDTLANATSLAAALRCMPEQARWVLGDCQCESGAERETNSLGPASPVS